MIKFVSITAGAILFLAGLIVFPLPVPFGAVMIVAGLVLLVSSSAMIARRLRSFRQHHPGANKVIQAIEDRLPERWKKAFRRSDP
ncbi:MAG: hypothetical protein JXQ99_03715 [Hyphomicrobiaceae bacterium]